MKRFLLILPFLLFALPARALNNCPSQANMDGGVFAAPTNCIYVDFVGGSDSNAGNSESVPFQHAPGMNGCTATCASTTVGGVGINGEIFKGGVTWTFAIWPWNAPTGSNAGVDAYGGCTGVNCIYLGVDKTWFTGIAWARPVFSGGSWSNPGTNTTCNRDMDNSSGPKMLAGGFYFIVDNFEFTQMCLQTPNAPPGGNNPAYMQDGTNFTVENSYFHQMQFPASYGTLGQAYNAIRAATTWHITNSVLDYTDSGPTPTYTSGHTNYWSGDGLSGGNVYMDHNVLTNMGDATDIAPVSVHDNYFLNAAAGVCQGAGCGFHNHISNDSTCVANSTVTWYNNVIDTAFAQELGFQDNTACTYYVFNNVSSNQSSSVTMFASGANGNHFYIFNNTAEAAVNGGASNGFIKGGGANAVYQVYNNHIVTGNGASSFNIGTGSGSFAPALSWTTSAGTVSNANFSALPGYPIANIPIQTQSAANGQGYTYTQTYQFSPTSGSGASVGVGVNQTAFCTAIGASNAATAAADEAACKQDTSYGVGYNVTTHTVVPSARVQVARPSSGAWDAGAYEYSATGAPVASFSPTSLTFPDQVLSTVSTPQTVTLTNTGTSNLVLSSAVALAGANLADYTISASTCTAAASIAPSGTCTFSVTFTPGALGSRTANWTSANNASNSPQTGAISGTGIASAQSLITCPAPNGCKFICPAPGCSITPNSGSTVQTTVTVSPNVANLSTTGTQQFTATVTGDPFNEGVTWVLKGTGCTSTACGTISASSTASGVPITYTAPATSPTPAAVTLTATSVLNPQVASSATANINVAPPPPPPVITVTIAPVNISVTTSATQTFTCTVTNDTTNVGCDFTLGGTSPQGSLSSSHAASGTPITYTAPSSASSAVTLTADSTASPTKTAVASIAVVASPVISVNVSPTTASVGLNSPQSITATVTNDGANLGVTWTATCGAVSPASTASGTPTTFTSPATAGTCTVTATSVANTAKSASAVITVSGPATVVNPCGPNVQTAAAVNTFSCPASQGSVIGILIGAGPAVTTSGAQACNPAGTCYALTQGCPPSGPCFSNVGGAMTTGFYGIGLPSGLTIYKVMNSAFANQIQAFILDMSNVTAFGTATIGGSSTASANPSLPITTTAAGVILATDATLAVSSIASPFNFISLSSYPVGGGGYAITSAPGTFTPTWTQTSAGYSLYNMSFISGFVSPVVGVSLTPASASVVTSATQTFTPTVSNSTQGVTYTLTGSGCSGATCGTISASSSASGVPITYTAPASVPSPATVTLTATSVQDPTKNATATITVTAAVVISVAVSPSTASVIANATQKFTSTTNDSAGTNYSLACTGSCGTVTPNSNVASGTSVTYTAPSSVPGSTVTLTSTSVSNPAKTATATITVTAPVVSVSVAPSSVTLNAGSTQSFTATVVNSAGTPAWTVSCSASACGSVSPTSGSSTTYTAPSTNSTISVALIATVGSATGTATITVNPVTTGNACTTNCPAFFAPSGGNPDLAAQGGGAATPGGRGGKVYEITTTADASPGCTATPVGFTNCSLRDFWMDTQGAGARYGVFRVAGIFPVTAGDLRSTTPFLTMFGQSAPGEVIIGGPTTTGALAGISTHDFIVRYVTYSPDNPNIVTGPDTGTTSIWIVNCPGVSPTISANANAGCYNIMFDHVTTRHSGNKSWITTSNFTPGLNGNGNGNGPNHNITTQWFLDYEPAQGHPVGYGTATDESCVSTLAAQACLSYLEVNIDFHHGMLMNLSHRIPENSNFSTRWVNIIIYNWLFYGNAWLGAETIDAINNKYITGNLNSTGPSQTAGIHFTTNSPEMSGAPSVYVSGNITGGPGTNTVLANQYSTSLVQQISGENGSEEGAIPSGWIRSPAVPMPASNAFPIVPDPANQLDTILLPTLGNSQHLDQNGNWVNHRDAQDARVILQYQNGGSGGLWPNGVTYDGVYYTQSSAAPSLPASCPSGSTCMPFPTIQANYLDVTPTSGTPCTSSLHDGMCDAWKTKYGLSTTDTGLYKRVDPVWGIPYIEVEQGGQVP